MLPPTALASRLVRGLDLEAARDAHRADLGPLAAIEVESRSGNPEPHALRRAARAADGFTRNAEPSAQTATAPQALLPPVSPRSSGPSSLANLDLAVESSTSTRRSPATGRATASSSAIGREGSATVAAVAAARRNGPRRRQARETSRAAIVLIVQFYTLPGLRSGGRGLDFSRPMRSKLPLAVALVAALACANSLRNGSRSTTPW